MSPHLPAQAGGCPSGGWAPERDSHRRPLLLGCGRGPKPRTGVPLGHKSWIPLKIPMGNRGGPAGAPSSVPCKAAFLHSVLTAATARRWAYGTGPAGPSHALSLSRLGKDTEYRFQMPARARPGTQEPGATAISTGRELGPGKGVDSQSSSPSRPSPPRWGRKRGAMGTVTVTSPVQALDDGHDHILFSTEPETSQTQTRTGIHITKPV